MGALSSSSVGKKWWPRYAMVLKADLEWGFIWNIKIPRFELGCHSYLPKIGFAIGKSSCYWDESWNKYTLILMVAERDIEKEKPWENAIYHCVSWWRSLKIWRVMWWWGKFILRRYPDNIDDANERIFPHLPLDYCMLGTLWARIHQVST